MLGAFREGEIGRILQNVLQDHVSRLPADVPVTAGDRMFVPRTRLVRPTGVDVDAVDRVATAIAELRRVAFEYVTFAGDECEVELEPWSVVFSDEGVYVLGMCVDGPDTQLQQRRLYNIARMTNLRILETAFVYPLPAEYDPDELFEHSFGVFLPPDDEQPAAIILRFATRWGAYLEHHKLHSSQFDCQVTEDGPEVCLRLYVTYDLVCWIRGLGEEVEVVQPEGVRRWVQSGRGATARDEFMTE
jgi:predicted DNA-binding transcriptional regulator YafY